MTDSWKQIAKDRRTLMGEMQACYDKEITRLRTQLKQQQELKTRIEDICLWYRNLLKKYISHVGECEGVCFTGPFDRETSSPAVVFTDQEWIELCGLETELRIRQDD